MKIKNSFFSALFSLAAVVGLVACSSEDYERIGAPDGSQVFFSSENASEYLLNENQNQVDVIINRVKTDAEATVSISAQDESGLFTVANTATFAAGEATAKVPVTFDFAKLESDKGYDITLNIESETCEYGDKSKVVTIKYAPWSEWSPLGWSYPSSVKSFEQWQTVYANASSANDYAKGGVVPGYTYNGYYSGGPYDQPVFYRESQLNPENAQLMLYDYGSGINLVINWNKATGQFSCPETYFVNDDNYGAVYVSDSYTYLHDVRGKDVTYEDFPSNYDAENGKFELYLAYYVSAGYFGTGPEIIQLPGYEKADYLIGWVNKGVAVQDGKITGQVLDFVFGADLGSVKYALFNGALTAEEVAANAAGIVDGSIASTTTKEQGLKTIPLTEEGEYTIIGAGYDNDGNYVSYDSYCFDVENPAQAESWAPLYYGDYTYTVFFTNDDDSPYVDEGLTLYQSESDPTKFKIEHWGYDVDFTFTMDDDGNIMVTDQYTGYTHPNYGEVWVCDYSDYKGDSKVYSYYENGTLYFCTVYYCEAGVFGADYETLTLSYPAAKALEGAVKKASKAAKAKGAAKKVVKKTAKTSNKKVVFVRGLKPMKN